MHAPPCDTQYPGGVSASDFWAHNTSMERATGQAQLGATSEKARIQSEALPAVAEGVTKLNEAVASVLGGLP